MTFDFSVGISGSTFLVFQVCTRVPPYCPGRGEWSFVVDLTSVDPEDISYDEHGSGVIQVAESSTSKKIRMGD